jgi:chromosome partitioning protein
MTAARIVAIAAHKGGAGKTTTALCLASALANAGAETLLIDLDPQAHSTIGLGVTLADDAVTVRDVLTDQTVDVERAIVASAVPRLSVLPSMIRLEHITQWLYMRPKREAILGKALKPIRRDFAWIVIDCPPSLGALTEMAIAAADLVIVPCRMEARASDGLEDLLELVAILRGQGWNGWRILKTQIDRRRSVTNELVMEALAPWTAQLLTTEIPQSEPLNQAQLARVDIYTFDPSCSGAAAYTALANEVQAWRKSANS